MSRSSSSNGGDASGCADATHEHLRKVAAPRGGCPRSAPGSLGAVIDLRRLREDPDTVRASQRARGEDPSLVDGVLDADALRRASLTEFETLRAEQKDFGKRVAQARGDEKQALVAQAKQLSERVKAAQSAADEAQASLDSLLWQDPQRRRRGRARRRRGRLRGPA